MFPHLPVIRFDDSALESLAQTMRQDEAGVDTDNRTVPAGYTFMGQFIDHDITFDPTSSLEQENDPEAVFNFRTPLLELDSVYAGGPQVNPYLYQADGCKFLIAKDSAGAGDDLPRNVDGVAIIGDPRNDENLVLSQFHLMFMRFHNAVVDALAGQRYTGDLFQVAQRITRWHYQWLVVNEFLPRMLGRSAWDEIFTPHGVQIRHFDPYLNSDNEPFIPVEFALAAYRFGHSTVRGGYSIHAHSTFALFPPPGSDPNAPPETLDTASQLTPQKRLKARRNIGWGKFFDMRTPSYGGNIAAQHAVQFSRIIDTRLARPLFYLPGETEKNRHNLALRNLMRGNSFLLPFGQAVALRIGVSRDAILTGAIRGAETIPVAAYPLWYYILREAEVLAQGRHLGPVGATIVGETFAALLIGDRHSYLSQHPKWKPWEGTPLLPITIPCAEPDQFTIADFLRFALPKGDPRLTDQGM
jgi:hypothetical protein